MKIPLIVSISLFASLSFASNLVVRSFDSKDCQSAGHSEEYVLKICDQVSLQNRDRVIIQGSLEQSNLTVTQGKVENEPYYQALGVEQARHQVTGDVQIVLQKTVLDRLARRALIYRLDYQRNDGQKGFQIITIRLQNGRKALNQTCTMAVYDSNTSSAFSGSDQEKEAAMRAQALSFVDSDDFKSQACLSDRPEESLPVSLPVDENEGDSLESSY